MFNPKTKTVAEVRGFFSNWVAPNITDQIIQHSLSTAVSLFGATCLDDETQNIAFMYLTGHFVNKFLSLSSGDINTLGDGQSTVVNSFSEGSYSESRETPDNIKQNPLWSDYNSTSYGRMYLNFAYVCSIGNVSVVGGGTPI